MSLSCPMSFKQIDSNVSRFTSLLVAIFVVTYFSLSEVTVLYILAIDFILRLFINKSCSPLFSTATLIKDVLKLDDKLIDSGSKRLANYFGLLFVLLLIGADYFNAEFFSMVVAAIFVSCALLDVVFNYCVGCKIYYIIKKIYPNFMS